MDGSMVVSHATFDICDKKLKPDLIRCNLAAWGIPPRCPFNQSSTFCYKGNKLLTFSLITQKMLPLFSLTNSVTIKLVIKHDTGISCFEADSKVTKSVSQSGST